MNRKALTRLLSIALALLLPAAAMAQGATTDMLQQALADGQEIVTTITFEPGAALAGDTVVTDLSKVTALRLTGLSGGYGALTVSLSGKDVVSALFKATKDGLFAQSEVLGDQPAFVAWADVQKSVEDMMKNSNVPEAQINQFSQGFVAGIQQAIASGTTEAGQPTAAPFTKDDLRQALINGMNGDDSFVKWLDAMQAKGVVTKGEYTVEGADKADTKTELTVTAEDMASFYEIPYIRNQMQQQIRVSDSSLTEEQAAAKTQEAIDQIRTELTQAEATMPMTFYTQGEGDGARLVAMDLDLTGSFTSTDTTTGTSDFTTSTTRVGIAVEAHYRAATKDEGETHAFWMDAKQAGKTVLSANLTFDSKTATGGMNAVDEKGNGQFTIALTADYADPNHTVAELALVTPATDTLPSTLLFSFERTVSDTAADMALSLSTGASVEAVKADAATALLGTLRIHTAAQPDSGFFASLKEASVLSSRQVLKMAADELNQYVTEIQGNIQKLTMVVMSNLPTSVLTQIFSQPSGT